MNTRMCAICHIQKILFFVTFGKFEEKYVKRSFDLVVFVEQVLSTLLK